MADLSGAIADLAAVYFHQLDGWQSDVLGAMVERSDGRFRYSTLGVSVPRQNGKNVVLEMRELFGAVFLGEQVYHTAHRVDTNRTHFLRMCDYFKETPGNELAKRLVTMRSTNGQESLEFSGGGGIFFKSRKQGALRGATADVLVFDEAQELTDEQLQALLPSASSGKRRDPQIIYIGTPPEFLVDSNPFYRLRRACLSGEADSSYWYELSAEPGCDLDDVETWRAANPAIDAGRMTLGAIQGERATLSDIGFMRERLGMWVASEQASAIPTDFWAQCAEQTCESDGAVALGLDISPARDQASVVAAERLPDGRVVVDLLDSRRGSVDWLAPYVAGICSRHDVMAVVCDSAGNAANIGEALAQQRLPVVMTNSKQFGRACASFFDMVVSRGLVHLSQDGLNAAVDAAAWRRLGDGRAWSRSTSTSDITALVAATLAVWGVDNQDKAPKFSKGTGKVAAW